LGPALGMEVLGMDLSRPLTSDDLDWIERSFAEHPVLVFRQQVLSAQELRALGRNFGSPTPHVLTAYRYPGCPEVSYLRNVDDAGNIDPFGVERATEWHSDETFKPRPPRLAILHALELPSVKGGTIFADMRAAYDALPEAMRRRLDGLVALHGYTDGPHGGGAYGGYAEDLRKRHPELARPAVITHPVSKRRVLFVNPLHTHGFEGMERAEAFELIEELTRHATEDRFTYYHNWQVGDVLMWDETATMHRGAGDYAPEERRVMLRTLVHPAAA
jgi:taurine dioxygenase